MLPSDKSLRMLVKLIQRTQSHTLHWQPDYRNVGGLSNAQRAYVADSNGITFRIDRVVDKLRSGLLGSAYGPKEVKLELVDSDNDQVIETLYESDGFPILRSLYKMVNQTGSDFDDKLDDFLGN